MDSKVTNGMRLPVERRIMRHIIIAAAALAFVPSAYAQTIEADNGAVFKIIQVIHPSRDGGVGQAQVYTPDGQIINLLFDCRGNMAPFDGHMHSIPPRSVGGRIGQIACARTHS
jgi:hypothetical protein